MATKYKSAIPNYFSNKQEDDTVTQEAFCPIHGPYDASLGGCPFCAQEGRSGAAGAVPGGGIPSGEEETRVYSGSGAPSSPIPSASDIDEMPTQYTPGGVMPGAVDADETVLKGRRWEDLDDLDVTVLEHKVVGTLGWLIIKNGDRRGRMFTLKPEVTIGRKHADIVIPDPKVSSLHAKIALVDGEFVLADVLSKNGTYVNGKRIKEMVTLKENDEIKIGGTIMVLKVLPEEED